MCTHFGNLFLIQSGPAKVSYLAPLASFLSLGRLFMCPKVKCHPHLGARLANDGFIWLVVNLD